MFVICSMHSNCKCTVLFGNANVNVIVARCKLIVWLNCNVPQMIRNRQSSLHHHHRRRRHRAKAHNFEPCIGDDDAEKAATNKSFNISRINYVRAAMRFNVLSLIKTEMQDEGIAQLWSASNRMENAKETNTMRKNKSGNCKSFGWLVCSLAHTKYPPSDITHSYAMEVMCM